MANLIDIINGTTGEMITREKIALDTDKELGEFLLKACRDFIEYCGSTYKCDPLDNGESTLMDFLPLEDKAKWLLGWCLADNEWGDIIEIRE